MHSFIEVFSHLNKTIYNSMGIVTHQSHEEEQNASYGAGLFSISSTIIRFRIAKKTPKKQRQFVAIWEKAKWENNKPYSYGGAPHFLIVTVFNTSNEVGQFIFPKDVLLEKRILESENTKLKWG
ncbi:MepB family protein [Shouchella sp. 1P09AA]|uniref:MepB family protein n=1 Tax=unclassified Shouchella TaxID=2893065 RepID=UPI0039A315FB